MKKVLFVSASLGLGGSEKCMAEMIRNMDLSKYEITVLALIGVKNVHGFDKKIRIINGYADLERMDMRFSRFALHALKEGKWKQLLAKMRYRLKVQKTAHHISQDFWEELSPFIPQFTECFDTVIGYGQGTASYFTIDKVPNAKRKILWLNTDLERARYNISFVKRFYLEADSVVADSQNGVNNLKRLFPEQKKVYCFPNMLAVESILKKSGEYMPQYSGKGKRLLTVGRFCEAKALHLAIEAAGLLKGQGYCFSWHIIGDGSMRPELEEQIRSLDLEDTVFLPGTKINPYPWFAECDIYVQTSIYEGSCMTINEAMLFQKPIVTTNFPAALEKVRNGENGLICSMTATSIAESIGKLLESPEICRHFAKELQDDPIFYGSQMHLLEKILD